MMIIFQCIKMRPISVNDNFVLLHFDTQHYYYILVQKG